MRSKPDRPLVLAILIVILGFVLLLFYRPFRAVIWRDYLSAVIPERVVRLVNEEREAKEIPALIENQTLALAAQLKAEDMAKREYFSHTSPEGWSPWVWLDQVGYRYQLAGENLAVNYFDSEKVARAWLASPTHRDNIIRPGFTETGVGMASGTYKDRPAVFIVQFFGRPR